MSKKFKRARKKRKKWWPYLVSLLLLVVIGAGIGAYMANPSLFSGLVFWKPKKGAVTTPSSTKKKRSDLPAVSTKDWQLILVNRENVKPELNPQLTDVADQTKLYNERVNQLKANGLSQEEAEKQVQTQVQVPGASEHQTGLAIDMSVEAGQSDELGLQLAAIAPQYGFVLRYPDGKSNITGVNFENWHFRYVGVESARYMQAHNLVLEEYIQLLKKDGK